MGKKNRARESAGPQPPRCSFIIAAYDRASMLAEAVESVLAQTVKDVEAVVVDDGSSDSTPRLMAYYTGKYPEKVHYKRFKKNKGASAARNHGIQTAAAPIVCILDSDDIALPDRAKITLAAFSKNPKAALFYGGCQICDFWGNVDDEMTEPKEFDLKAVQDGADTFIAHSAMALRREWALRFPYESGDWFKLGLEDYRLICDMALAGAKFCFAKEPVSIYRRNEGTVSTTRDKEAVTVLKKKYWSLLGASA